MELNGNEGLCQTSMELKRDITNGMQNFWEGEREEIYMGSMEE